MPRLCHSGQMAVLAWVFDPLSPLGNLGLIALGGFGLIALGGFGLIVFWSFGLIALGALV